MSIWSEMGVRDGQFSGVKPLSAIDAIWNFFNDVRYAVYMSPHIGVYPEEWLWKVGFTFDGRYKFSRQDSIDVDILRNGELKLPIVESGPDFVGSFISADTWCQAPDWTLDKFIKADSEALTDDIVLHPLVSLSPYGPFVLAEDFSWYRQRYALIQKLRFLVVPMDIWYKSFDGEWWQEYHNVYEGGYLYFPCKSEYEPCFSLNAIKGVRFSIPDYWAQDGVDFKIGVQIDPSKYSPVKGQFWYYGKTYTIETEKRWDGSGVFSAFAVVDLATHPDFAKYYDAEAIECPSLPGPESYPESSSSSSSIVLPSESQSFTSPSSPSPSSSGGGGGGGCTLKEAYFRLNSKRRTVGAVFSYTSVEVGEGPDTYLDYYAVSWNGYKGTKLYESISADVFNAACDTWLPVGVSLDVIRNGMQEAAQDIYATNVNAPWQDGGIYVDGATRVSGNDKADFTISGKKEYTISQWAFTANPLSNNTSNPAQCFGELMLVSTNDGITSVDVKIGDKVFTMAVGDTLGWDELKEFFQYGNLPKPELGDCYPDFVEPSERILWPLLYNVNNATYPWGNMGKSQSLKIEIVGYICEKAKSVVANTATETNAYTNALPEDLK